MNKNKKSYKYLLDAVLVIIIIILLLHNFISKDTKNLSEKSIQIQEENKKSNIVSTENWDLEKVNIVYDSEGTPVPVPKGFVGSNVTGENTINTGFVIYETENEVNDENAWDMQITKNQFVWIPIYDVNEIYGRDENGIAHGKLYTFNNSGRSNLNWLENNDKSITINYSSNNEPIREEIIQSYVPNYLSGEGKAYNQYFESTISSIIMYGGFYIGRYETGYTDIGATIHKMNTDISYKSWNDAKDRCKGICKNDNVVTEMIYGCQFDAVLQWLVDTNCKNYLDLNEVSYKWGNYIDSTFTYQDINKVVNTKGYTSLKLPTGCSEYTKANNIYDLAGNVWEWTQETNGSKAVCRGGTYNDSGKSSEYASAQYRLNYEKDSNKFIGSRVMLYIALDFN